MCAASIQSSTESSIRTRNELHLCTAVPLIKTTLDLTGHVHPLGIVSGLLRQNRTSDLWMISDRYVLKWYHGQQEPTPKLSHPHLLPILDQGGLHGRYYEVYPFLPKTLEEHPITPEAFLAAIRPAVEYLHLQGLIHGDIKPSNILLDERDWLYLGDYSSLRAGKGRQTYTRRKNPFAAPETRLSYVSPASDWYNVEKVGEWLAMAAR